MSVWFDNPTQLFNSKKILDFWPTSEHTANDRVNASTRFIIYMAAALYLIKRDPRLLILGSVIVAILYILYKDGRIKNTNPIVSPAHEDRSSCQRPSKDNAMANVLMTDYVDRPDRPSACDYNSVQGEVAMLMDNTFPYDAGRSRSPLPAAQKKAAARQFMINPATTIPNDQTAFAEFCYGKKDKLMCRDTPSTCDPNFWGAQPEAFGGLDPSGHARTGMTAR